MGPFDCGTRILRVIHGRDARATLTDPLPVFATLCELSAHFAVLQFVLPQEGRQERAKER